MYFEWSFSHHLTVLLQRFKKISRVLYAGFGIMPGRLKEAENSHVRHPNFRAVLLLPCVPRTGFKS